MVAWTLPFRDKFDVPHPGVSQGQRILRLSRRSRVSLCRPWVHVVLPVKLRVAKPLFPVASDVHPAFSAHFLTPFLDPLTSYWESIFFLSFPPQNYIFSSVFFYILSLALTVIHYNFIGVLDLPEVEEYPDNVVLDSRQGVAIEYLVGKAS